MSKFILNRNKKIAVFMTVVMAFTPIMGGHLRKANSDKRINTVVSDLNLGPTEDDTILKNKAKKLSRNSKK